MEGSSPSLGFLGRKIYFVQMSQAPLPSSQL